MRACTMSVCSLYTKAVNTAFGNGTGEQYRSAITVFIAIADNLAYIIKRSSKENMDFYDLIGRSISPDLSRMF